KFSAFIGSAEPGTKAGIEVQNLRITSSEEAGAMSGRSEVIVYPNSKHAIKSTNDMMKIYFHFDNEDYSTIFHRRKKDKLKYEDNCQYPGFRDMLLETVRDQTIIVTDPKDADVIVYSGARPDPADAGRIAEAVKNGTPLFSAGVINDPVIAALLPGKISILPNTGIPDRLRLKPVNTDDPLFIGLNSMEFGIYLNILPDQDSHVLLSYANGSPAIIENKSNKSKIIYSAIAIGADLIPGKKAYDPFLLRVLSYLSGKKIREENEAVINSINGFYAGFTEENFGRFGFTLSDGLLVESINSSLHVINGAQEYSFSSGLTPKITLSKWSITSINAKPEEPKREINHLYKYLGIGKFELLAKCIIPKDWSSKSVFFSVESGIDDIAEVYFNNMLIGRVTTNMPEYWMRPHYYAVNSSLIRFGEKNEILIKTENLRGEGGFGSCPELLAFSGTGEAWKFVPDRINCLGKGGVITEHDGSSRRFDTSLAFPGVRWEIFSDSVDIALQNIASFAAFQSGNKINIVDLSGTKNLPTDWSAPWLLLFRKGKEHPLLLVFDQKPSQIKIKHTGEAVAGISIERKGGAGMILPLWLYGTASVDSIEWNKSIPEETLARIAFWYPRAFLYPVELDEKFHIDEASGQIAIRSEYRYKKATGEWSDKNVKPYAPVSPLAFFMKGKLFESSTVKDFNLVTSFGNYAACDGSDTAEWTLPLPSPDLSVIPAISGFEKVREIVNMVFSSAVCFSAGGGAKISDWTPAFPQGTENPTIFNINMHGYLAGLNQTMGMPYLLDEENSAALKKRVRERIFEPIELYRYKSAQRWREEPMSGIRYPVFYNSYYVHTTKYAEGFGSSMNYGDQNETAHMILAVMQALADRFGQRDFVLANRNFIYHAARILLVSDDWAYMSCHCRESGLSATIDMLNCEYSSMMKLARLAEIIGDKALRAQALYRGSRRMVPTLARFYFREYAINNNLVDYPENIATCVGFTEQGMHYRTKGTLPNMLDLYDMSQGIPSDIIPLYQRFLHKAQENYFKNIVFPTLFNKEGEYSLDTTMLSIIAQDSVIESSILEKAVISLLKHEKKIKKLSSDWPGMTLVPDIAQVLYKLHGVVKIKSIKNSELKVFKYDPKLKILYIKFVPETQAELILQSRLAPADPSFKVDPLGCITITTGPVGKEQDIVIHF
ncbi:MAG TPA: hypothetical protein DC049_10245, partial [Spirochaetia bacterium]|nr:hypothetical protein [Spirochaetia bacterium]